MHSLDDHGLDKIFRNARTANLYLPGEVTEDDLRAIWGLAKWGPTSANSMPARIVWCLSQQARDKLADCASETNAKKIRTAPAAAILGMDLEFHEKLPALFPHADARSWFVDQEKLIHSTAFRNSTLQGAYVIIAARALGFDVGPMSGFDNDAVDAAFFEGTPIRSNFLMTIGRGDPASIFPRSPRLAFDEATRVE
jgi:3-hydroxypropanoate dehydrogenase